MCATLISLSRNCFWWLIASLWISQIFAHARHNQIGTVSRGVSSWKWGLSRSWMSCRACWKECFMHISLKQMIQYWCSKNTRWSLGDQGKSLNWWHLALALTRIQVISWSMSSSVSWSSGFKNSFASTSAMQSETSASSHPSPTNLQNLVTVGWALLYTPWQGAKWEGGSALLNSIWLSKSKSRAQWLLGRWTRMLNGKIALFLSANTNLGDLIQKLRVSWPWLYVGGRGEFFSSRHLHHVRSFSYGQNLSLPPFSS